MLDLQHGQKANETEKKRRQIGSAIPYPAVLAFSDKNENWPLAFRMMGYMISICRCHKPQS
jgi:hypothetical protein